jgi:hypothetical protein
VSGTDFYNLFSDLAIGADGYCDGGQINVDGTPYDITRLAKGANSLTFYTSGGTITVNKFQEGTSVGVYTELAITEAINFQAVAGGIEVKHIFPWGTQAGTPGTYDIGTLTERFSTAYLQYLDVLNNVLIRGALAVTGAISGASLGVTGPISGTAVTGTTLTITGSEGVRTAGAYTIPGVSVGVTNLTSDYKVGTAYKVKKSGTYTSYMALSKGSGTSAKAYGKVYVNGSPVGTQRSISDMGPYYFSENITVVAGDLIQVAVKMQSTGEVYAIGQLSLKCNEEGIS